MFLYKLNIFYVFYYTVIIYYYYYYRYYIIIVIILTFFIFQLKKCSMKAMGTRDTISISMQRIQISNNSRESLQTEILIFIHGLLFVEILL